MIIVTLGECKEIGYPSARSDYAMGKKDWFISPD
jgi:hypothetical protein